MTAPGAPRPPRTWDTSGLAALTGAAGLPARPVRDPTPALERLLRQTEAAAHPLGSLTLDFSLFTERAMELGLECQGRTACNGSARMLKTEDGWAAVNLARADDVELVPAWIERPLQKEPWDELAEHARKTRAKAFVARGRLLGLAASIVRRPGEIQPRPWRTLAKEPATHPPGLLSRPLCVVDLSALWAGPLCGRLFADLGAHVIKVESPRRPDAARSGSPRLFERLHRGQEMTTHDFSTSEGLQGLASLIDSADVVIESSRPRALEQLGFQAAAILARRPGLTWISITAYGREGEASGWIGFGDDVAASAGLVAVDAAGDPVFLGDAIADPIAGLTAARDGLQALARGGGMVAVSMQAAAAAIANADLAASEVAA